MARYVICPRCELNYIDEETQEFCDVCVKELQGAKTFTDDLEENESYGGRDLKIYVTGNGFLYNMVRTMVGELLDLASQKRTAESLSLAFKTGKRELLGKTMPAKGLTLLEVNYSNKE